MYNMCSELAINIIWFVCIITFNNLYETWSTVLLTSAYILKKMSYIGSKIVGDLTILRNVSLKCIQKGIIVENKTCLAPELWKDKLTVVFVVRRSGWALCREEAKDLATRHKNKQFGNINLVGIIKEIAGVTSGII